MYELKNFLKIDNFKDLLPFLDNTLYLYSFFVIIFFLVFFLISTITKSSKKRKTETIERKQPNLDEIVDTRNLNVNEDNEFVDVLVAIEEEMTAIRELYVGGYISKGVYISETDRLYEKAKIFGI